MSGGDGGGGELYVPVVPVTLAPPQPEHVMHAEAISVAEEIEVRVTGADGVTYAVTLPSLRSAVKPQPVRDDIALDE